MALTRTGVYIARVCRCMLGDNMVRYQNTKSITIDKLIAPSPQPTEIRGVGSEGMRVERTGVDRTTRGDR
jgi:hypothetical protein